MRAPFNGFCAPYFSRKNINPGISFSASVISLRPKSAREMSATLYAGLELAMMLERMLERNLYKNCTWRTEEKEEEQRVSVWEEEKRKA
jgi:mannose/fructose-specific phosphotransferase system component IIA